MINGLVTCSKRGASANSKSSKNGVSSAPPRLNM
ncbi:hypothetical protein D046_9011, partial [Vibrio parahaemolyticus V-223/04]